MRIELLDRLAPCQRILLVGAGGGFDILSGVPLYCYLRSQGKQVFLASLSFARLRGAAAGSWLKVDRSTDGDADYFPERYLSGFLDEPIYCFKNSGAQVLHGIYQDLVRELAVEALVLVDGGTDSLMRGDEPGLGTPHEDMASLAAAHMLDLPVRLLVNLGFGVDTYHGVSHAFVLQAIAELTAAGGFLGGFSLLPGMPEFQALVAAQEHLSAAMPEFVSIVGSSIVAAGQGHFGDHHSTDRTAGSTLFINPLMSMYWGFEVDAVARRCLYLEALLRTQSQLDVERVITSFRRSIRKRPWMDIPL